MINDGILSKIWQLPQNVCALMYLKSIEKDIICLVNNDKDYVTFLYRGKKDRVIGEYVFLCQNYSNKNDVISYFERYINMSRKYGWFYFIVRFFDTLKHMI